MAYEIRAIMTHRDEIKDVFVASYSGKTPSGILNAYDKLEFLKNEPCIIAATITRRGNES